MQRKKIALLASILMVTLVVGVYAVIISNTLTAEWNVVSTIGDLTLWWEADTPHGDLARGVWYETTMGLKNTGEATYMVTDRFTIHADGYVLPDGCITIEYRYNDPIQGWIWVDIYSAIDGWGTTTISGHFGPLPEGFECGPGYYETTLFRYMFEGDAPLTSYTFNAWVEQIP